MKSKLIFIFIFFCFNKSNSQPLSIVKIGFYPVYREIPIVLDSIGYMPGNRETIKFETLKFYISNIQFMDNDKIVFAEKNSYHLVDASNENSKLIQINFLPQNSYNEIRFNLGIDSVTNVAGVLGGDLDPTKGMYWTWQSGYVNLKLEGKSNVNNKDFQFQFHLGGYQFPFNSMQTIRVKSDKKDLIKIYFDLKKFFDAVDLSANHHVMSPNTEAMELSSLAAKCFYTK